MTANNATSTSLIRVSGHRVDFESIARWHVSPYNLLSRGAYFGDVGKKNLNFNG